MGAGKTFALTGVYVWDGEAGARSREPWTLRIRDEKIEAMGPQADLAAGVRSIPLSESTALPGLIDAHVHLCLDPAIGPPAEQDAVPGPERIRAMEARAEAMLKSGITTARDLGGGNGFEIELRDRIARRACAGPRLLCAGQPVTTPGGHCHFWGGEAEGPEEIRAVIRRQIERRVDWIKVMATGGVMTRGTKPIAPQFDVSEIACVVEEAARHGRSVAAHCHGTVGIANAVEAGVRTVEHCSFAGRAGFGADFDAQVVERIARSGAWVSPTVNRGWGRRAFRKPENEGDPVPHSEFFERMQRVFEALRAAGVRLIASTDAGIPGVEHHRLAEALVAFAGYADLSPLDVLRTATSQSADALGIGNEVGRLRPGFQADILVVEGDPLVDLSVLQRPRAVVAAGELVTP
ncbi:MAG: amidohydrolase family protein [Myxococcota bacterium]